MSSNFDTDNFEQLIRERSDEFKMYPTKRVWYSIYNNIHPGKKWPSIATCITLISILLLVGYLNTNIDTKNISGKLSSGKSDLTNKEIASSKLILSNFVIPPFLQVLPLNTTSFLNLFDDKNAPKLHSFNISNNPKINTIASVSTETNFSITRPHYKKIATKNINNKEVILQNTSHLIVTDLYLPAASKVNNGLLQSEGTNNSFQPFLRADIAALGFKNNLNSNFKNPDLIKITKEGNDINNQKNVADIATILSNENNNIETGNEDLNSTKNKSTKIIYLLTDAEKAWVESYAMHNRPLPKKWLGKLGWQIYITPSVVYRTLKNTLPNEQDINNFIIQKPALGLEIGGGIISTIFKGVKLKTGLQLNFTRYNAEAYENSHPVATSITVRTAMGGQSYQESRSTPYSNIDGISPIKLHNETFQISIPMGMDVKLAGFNNLQWSVGATIQPSYIIGGKSYLISSDKRNYIKETSLLNRWNLDAGFETFISYKTNGFTLQFGPQFRKQLFTTNNKNYFIQEYLTNYGFKFGISKLIK